MKADKKNHKNGSTAKLQKKIGVRDKLFKKLKKSNLHIEKEIYEIVRYEVQKLIAYKKKTFLRIYSVILLVNLKSFGRL